MNPMKGVLSKDGISTFRVNLGFYPKELAVKIFGKDFEETEKYLIFRKKLSEKEIYEKFNQMLGEIR